MSTSTSEASSGGAWSHAERLHEKREAMTEEPTAMLSEIEDTLRTQLNERPYAVLAAAAGAGYVLAAGVPHWIARMLFGIGSRVFIDAALKRVWREYLAGDES